MTKIEPLHLVIGARLVAIREAFSDMQQAEWAKHHHFGVTQWNNWEKGVRRIPLEAAEKLARDYGLTLDFIYLGEVNGLTVKAANSLSGKFPN